MNGWQKDKGYKDVLKSRDTAHKRKSILWDDSGNQVTVSFLENSHNLLMNNLAFSGLISDEGLDAEID